MKKISKSYYDKFHDYGSLLPARIIYFGSEGDVEGDENGVDYASTKKLIKNLLYLDNLSHKLITLYWSSPGGDWHRGMAVYDIIKHIKSPIKFIGLGMVRSMGTIIIQACKYRYLTKHCDYMVHDGREQIVGESKTVENWAVYAKYTREQMYKIYLEQIKKKHKRFTLKQIEDMCTHDCIMTAEKAVKLGLADKII